MTFPQATSELKEKLIGRSKQHPAVFIMPLLPLLFSVFIFIFGLQASSPGLYFLFSFGFFIVGITDGVNAYVHRIV